MRRVYAVVVIVVACLALVGVMLANVAYTRHVQQQSDQRWCALFATLDRPVPMTIKDPVQRARSERAQRQFHQLRVDLGCIREGG